MTTLAYTVPTAGTDLNAIADPEIATALTSIKTAFNGNIDVANLSAAAQTALGAVGTWQPLTPATSITSGGYGASSRLEGDKVRLKGTLTNGTGSTDTGTLATITAAHRPSATLSLSAAASGAAPTVNVQITAAGALADPNGLVAGAILSLDGLTYTLS